jgi:hypothetical protein
VSSKLTVERVLERPSPDLWAEDELMTLAEAARLFWPKGPLTEETLRTAVRDGRLPVSEIARKLFVTKAALRELNVCKPRPTTAPTSSSDPSDDEGDFVASIEAMGRHPPQARR